MIREALSTLGVLLACIGVALLRGNPRPGPTNPGPGPGGPTPFPAPRNHAAASRPTTGRR